MNLARVVRGHFIDLLFPLGFKAYERRWQILIVDKLTVVLSLCEQLLLLIFALGWRHTLLRQVLLDLIMVGALEAWLIRISVRINLVATHQVLLGAGDRSLDGLVIGFSRLRASLRSRNCLLDRTLPA